MRADLAAAEAADHIALMGSQDPGAVSVSGVRQQAGASSPGVPACTTHVHVREDGTGITLDEAIYAYEEHGEVKAAAKSLRICKNRLCKILNDGGHKLRRLTVTQPVRDRIHAYYTETPATDFDLDELAAELSRHKANVSRIARDMGLTDQRRPLRPDSRAQQGAAVSEKWKREGHPRGMAGKKHTGAALEKVSAASKTSNARRRALGLDIYSEAGRQANSDRSTKMQASRPPESAYSRCKGGRRADVGPMYFRSAWEANYARYLNWLQGRGEIDRWEYEPETFWFEAIKRGVRSYKPDFRIFEKGASYFVEVKGWMDPKSRTKLRRMKKYHPSVEVRLFGAKDYASLASKLGRVIPGWE